MKNLEEIKEAEPLQYENLKRQRIHSLVVVPLYNGKKVIVQQHLKGLIRRLLQQGDTKTFIDDRLQIMDALHISVFILLW